MPISDGGNDSLGGANNHVENTTYPTQTTNPPVTPPATTPPTPTTTPTPGATTGTTTGIGTSGDTGHTTGTGATASGGAQVVPGQATGANQVNIADYAAGVATNPSTGMAPNELLANQITPIDPNTSGTNLQAQSNANSPAAQATTEHADATTSAQVDPRQAASYTADQSQQNVAQNGQSTAAQGQVNQNDLVTAPQLDMQGTATGVNADGSINYTGQALKQAAIQNISNIIDTSTPSGKALADALGPTNYTDSKATLEGQLSLLQSQFQDANGNPKIPAWASATARNVSKIAAFTGMSGTAATAAMAQAIMEASIPVAQQDAQFFQTVTLQNLSNTQAATINKANVLANFDLTNMDNRMTAAVDNSKAFLQMNMANLSNAQQSEMLNTQSRVQSILADSNAANVAANFNAQSQNQTNQFYDQLNTSIGQFNAAQLNGMSQYNTSQSNATSQFNASLATQNDQFEKNMQFNIDSANAKWRQSVTTQNSADAFNAHATDVKNLTALSQEQLNNIWQRSDSLLDYAWKSSENAADRAANITMAKLQSSLRSQEADAAGTGAVVGSILGKAGSSLLNWAFG